MRATLPLIHRTLIAGTVLAATGALAAPLPAQQLQPTLRVVREASPDGGGRAVEGPNGRTIVVEQKDGLVLYDRVAKTVTPLVPSGHSAAWSPRGTAIVFARQEERGRNTHVWMIPMDSAGGTPTGAARRVGARTGAAPAVSPDGRSVAYVNSDSTGSRLLVAPITGGIERTVLEEPVRLSAPQWTGDGLALFVHRARPVAQGGPALLRVPLAGGKTTTVVAPYYLRLAVLTAVGANAKGSLVHGFAPGAEARQDRTPMRLTDAAGKSVGTFLLAPRMRPSAWSMASPTRMLVNHWVGASSIHVVDVATGVSRPLTDPSSADRAPQYSPDGQQVAYQTLVGDRFQIAVVPAAGGARRVFTTAAEPRAMRWSPDGSAIAFVADQDASLHVLDMRSGAVRRLAGDVDRHDTPRWRADGRAIRYARSIVSVGKFTMEVRQVTLEGVDGVVRVFGPVMPTRTWSGLAVRILSDTLAAVLTPGELAVVDLRTGARRTVHRGDVSLGDGRSALLDGSPDGRWLAASVTPAGGGERVLLVATDGSGVRQTGSAMACGAIAWWSPTGSALAMLGYPDCEGPNTRGRLYLLPTDGSDARLLTTKDGPFDVGTPSFSPDGRSIVYEADAPWQARLVEVDFAGTLQASRTTRAAPARR